MTDAIAESFEEITRMINAVNEEINEINNN